MKYCIILFLTLAFTELSAQAGPDRSNTLIGANEVKFSSMTPSTASTQSRNWKIQKDQNPANAGAWFNYYLWTSRDKQASDHDTQKKLAEIVEEARPYIGNQPQFDLIVYLQSGKKDSASIKRVIASTMDKKISYPYIIQFFVATKSDSALKKYCREWESISPLQKDLRQYHHNTLMSADKNASLYAKGINDLVPLAVLQQVYGVRKDVKLKTYEGKIYDVSQAYLALSLGKETLEAYPNAIYTGLLIKLSGDNSIDELKGHVEKGFDLSYLNDPDQLSPDAAQLYKNYLPSFILLYNYYKKAGDSKAPGMKLMIKKIADAAGITGALNNLIGE
jgi:hypothetical protein